MPTLVDVGEGRGRPPGSPPAPAPGFDPSRPYQLHPAVAVRPEPFGALAYHYGSRRLTFLRSLELAQVVRALHQHPSADAALAAVVPERHWPAYRRALESLASSGFIHAR